jgi:hypothetical protein
MLLAMVAEPFSHSLASIQVHEEFESKAAEARLLKGDRTRMQLFFRLQFVG